MSRTNLLNKTIAKDKELANRTKPESADMKKRLKEFEDLTGWCLGFLFSGQMSDINTALAQGSISAEVAIERQKEIDRLKKENDEQRNEIDRLNQEIETLRDQELPRKNMELRRKNKERGKQNEDLHKKHEEARRESDELRRKNNQLLEENNELRRGAHRLIDEFVVGKHKSRDAKL